MNIIHKGVSIFYTDEGQGTPVVLLHGFLENSTMWAPFITDLSKKHRVVTIDLLGHGKSATTGYIHTMEEMARAVYAVIGHLDLKTIQVIGHSMGGYVGLAFAKAYPEHITGLCLLNSTPEADTNERKVLRARANEMAQKQYEQLVRMSFINLFDPQTKENFSEEIALALHQALQTPVQGYIAANAGMANRLDVSNFWREATFKKGMILGHTDWIIDVNHHQKAFGGYSDYFTVLNTGHMSHITDEQETLHSLWSFLNLISEEKSHNN